MRRVIEIEARLSELEALGLRRKTRLVSGPQGPRVVLDGKPTVMLASSNYLGLADHPRVREAAAEAAKRWGAGAGGSRLTSGTMTIHRRLEERLAAFTGRQSALLLGSGYLANLGVIAALARPGDVVFADELSHASIIDGCRLSGAEVFVYDHLDTDHLAWGIAKAEGRGALIATDSVFWAAGDVAPLAEVIELGRRRRLRVLVNEAHAIGTVGPHGRGVLAHAGLEDDVDVITGTLATALGSYGAFVACDREIADYLLQAAPTLIGSTAPPPPAAAAALAALTLLEERPELVDRLRGNTLLLRRELERHGLPDAGGSTHIVSVDVGGAELAERICERAFERGVFVEAVRPPMVAPPAASLRLSATAAHRADELRSAAQALAEAARVAGYQRPVETLYPGHPEPAVFDVEADDRLAA